jgi:NAD-dependent deacetylase
MSDQIATAAQALADADRAVALTGAGVSTASGIPDFRSEGGLWEKYDPQEFHYSRFKSDPAGFWELRSKMQEDIYGGTEVQPNSAHDALATLEAADVLDTLVTQNIDGLHAEAGSSDIVELHGNAERVVCEQCNERAAMPTAIDAVESGNLPPRCSSCDGVLKPDVVLFGEQLPHEAISRAQKQARNADAFLAVGSSLQVQPAARLPLIAARTGADLIIVNLEETPVSEQATVDIRADVTDALPRIAETLA